ncbi:alpha-galactosidase [Bacteroides sp. GM023]|uniref:alpha-galactosidase n=1 Tax=Bacteroides sp. GM023 TaxID=2723058 RepID=UPI00168A5E43|nr:alpha-galactosidase [Bacteroides sp. GM023]MBD3588651.1 alpha-galactosidase [Bacteroides sp. GM023]
MKRFYLFVLLTVVSLPALWAWDNHILISTPRTSLLLYAEKGNSLRFQYFGDKITSGQIPHIYSSGNGLNRPAYPVFGASCSQTPALQVEHASGDWTLDMVTENIETRTVENAQQIVITLVDKLYPFIVKLYYKAYDNVDMIETWAEISHTEKKAVTLKRFDSGHFLLSQGDVWISHMHGSWASETFVTTERLEPGMKVIKNMDGSRNGQNDHAEIMLSLDGKPNENAGRVVGAALCWSGNYKFRIDTDNNSVHHIFAGINDEASEYKLEPKEVFITPKLAITYSKEGLSGASRNFHRWARNNQLHNGWGTRDILLNSWEGVYFGINEPGMDQMMSDIAGMGGELFVMDDGWFGSKYPRKNDVSSLGDWVVDTNKLPKGIKGLTDTAKKYGIKFGIWIEPESTNSQSELFEKHPDWVLQVKGRAFNYGRGGTQLLLDLCNPEVQDFAFNLVDTLLTNYPEIAYIKWDANTELKNYGSTYLPKNKQSHIYIDYHRGLIKVLERIRAKYPDVVIQACGGGGGRVNYGVMPYNDEFWVSDNTDALQRIYMQWGTSYFYPSNAMAQHVSASPNHQTGRRLPLKFRFDVAMSGRLGMEIQPKNMTEDEKVFARKSIESYKKIRPVIQLGNLYRLASPYDRKGVASLMYTNDEQTKAVFFAYKMEHFANQMIPRIRLAGLDPQKNYKLKEVTPNGKPCFLDEKLISGSVLMNTGLAIPLWQEYASVVLELTAE